MSNKPIVLLIHGMGIHPPENMSKEFKEGLTEAAIGFGVTDFNLDDHIEIVEFNYSESFDAIRARLAEQSNNILGQFNSLPGQGAAIDLVQRLIQYQADLDKDEMIYTHWLDVLLYGATYYGEQVRVELAKVLNDLKARAAGRDIHIVAHSLGTALTHDTLNKLYRDDGTIDDGFPHLKPGIDNIKCLWTFASVNRLVAMLNGISDKDGVMCSGPTGCTNYLFNVRHELDPFTWYRCWKPDISDGANITTKVVRDINTHSFQEYVADPGVARLMLLQMTPLQQPRQPAKFKQCKERHLARSINGLYDLIEQETRELRENEVRSAPELLLAIHAFVETSRALRDKEGRQ
ncbi:MAG: alpha/beta hydrolase [Saccharospirillum sp.]|nr:alpha/beta hydrolase [Saccharospirillum sp.]